MLQTIICKKVRKYIDEDANEKLAEAQTSSKLADALETNALKMISVGGDEKSRIDISSIFDSSLASKFFIDFRYVDIYLFKFLLFQSVILTKKLHLSSTGVFFS